MRIKQLGLTIWMTVGILLLSFGQNQTPQEYIEKWKEVAIEKMKIHKIPASITLAQGILESGSGNSKLARLANNHFGIKCHSSWTGETFYQDDDEKDECFRKYKSASESYEDHANFLKKSRYQPLFLLDITDYSGWAHGLKKAGYATNPKYPKLLISIIERYNLSELDSENLISNEPLVSNKNKDKKPLSGNQETITLQFQHSVSKTANLVPFIIIKKNDSYEKLEKEFAIRKWQIIKYNDLKKNHELTEGERIFLKPKRCKSEEEFHIVKAGETMRDISQLYGVKLKRIYKRNGLDEGVVPKQGQRIYLRSKKKVS
jgi:LysM repeat protein